jgi:nucleotide-binding universal stress UspA family protein
MIKDRSRESCPSPLAQANSSLREALSLSRRGADILEEFFPSWEVHAQIAPGSPAAEVVKKAELWKADLVAVGSHGLAALGRLFLGSVSQKIVTDAHCSVRVARKRQTISHLPPRILIGIDGSPYAEAAARAVATRHWHSSVEGPSARANGLEAGLTTRSGITGV